jgi:hypothetical protein
VARRRLVSGAHLKAGQEVRIQLDCAETEALADARHHARRRETVELFRAQMAAGEWGEDEWEEFFASNVRIFGHGLAYQFVRMLERQAYVGGKGLDRRGGHVVDWMAHTEARAKFTVLVDIKLPQSRLLGPMYAAARTLSVVSCPARSRSYW